MAEPATKIELHVVAVEKPEELPLTLGQSHFIKTVEDLHEALAGAVPGHLYWACVDLSSLSSPTIARLLSENALAVVAQIVRAAVRLGHRARLAFRMTELNSVTCGGLAGVSDTFVTALWAPDALFELLLAGVDGVNVHVFDPT
jgi:hypothetical protein